MTTSAADISLADLRGAVTGPVIGPGDDAYEEARAVFPGGIDHRPAAIVKVDRLTLTGFPAWAFWSLIHIYFLIGLRYRLAGGDWVLSDDLSVNYLVMAVRR